ncbi:hypothetical protein PV325_001887 [Microctonus aethiopoides]|nr:hypothetical protein PV325_001887 [Microctonus aethiopoides]
MFLSINQVLEFLESTPSSRNFVEGEKIINSGHLIYCGLKNPDADQYDILSYCLQSSAFRNKPHEIETIINKNDEIVSLKYNCTAGLSERCKHVAAVLLFCIRNDLSHLKTASCTDKKCVWSGPRKSCLEQYDAKPLSQHKCYQIKKSKHGFPKDLQEKLIKIIFSKDLKSTLSEHV